MHIGEERRTILIELIEEEPPDELERLPEGDERPTHPVPAPILDPAP